MNMDIDEQGRAVVRIPLRVWVDLSADVERSSFSQARGIETSSVGDAASVPSTAAKQMYVARGIALSSLIADRLIQLQNHAAQRFNSTNSSNSIRSATFSSQYLIADNFMVKSVVDIPQVTTNYAANTNVRENKSRRADESQVQIPSIDIDDIGVGFFSSITDNGLMALHEKAEQRQKAKQMVQQTNEPCYGFFTRMQGSDDSRGSVEKVEPSSGSSAHESPGEAKESGGTQDGGNGLDKLKDVDPEQFLHGLVDVEVTGSLKESFTSFEDSAEEVKERFAQLHQVGVLLYLIFSRGAPLAPQQFDSNVGSLDAILKIKSPSPPYFKRGEESPMEETKIDGQRKKGQRQDRFSKYEPLLQLGVPFSVCRLVFDLVKSKDYGDFVPDNALFSLNDMKSELSGMISQPRIFLEDKDVSFWNGKLLFPDKLFGRRAELDGILRAVRASRQEFQTKNHLVVVSGYSGSGKSRLVNEAKYFLTRENWVFIRASFDRSTTKQSLTSIYSSIEVFFSSLLKRRGRKNERDSKGVAYCNQVIDSIERNIPASELSSLQYLIPSILQLIPEISKFSKAPALSSKDGSSLEHNANRLSYLFRLIVSVISCVDHPIMLILEDLHWADDSVMDLVRDLMLDSSHLEKSVIGGSLERHFVVVATYREGEESLGEDHFDNFMNAVAKPHVTLTNIRLQDLCQDSIHQMISEVLCLPPRYTKSLSEVVHSKTSGNPFFIKSFLESMVQESNLFYSIEEKRWVWDSHVINEARVNVSVAKLLARKILRLPSNVQEVLKIVSCFGIQAPKCVIKETYVAPLECAVHEGLLEKGELEYYRFVHDEIRSVAYNLIPVSDRAMLHFKIGQDIINSTLENALPDAVILLAMNQIARLHPREISDPELCCKLARLNLRAGYFCMSMSNFHMAMTCIEYGKSCLNESHWKSDYDLMLRLTDAACTLSYVTTQTSKTPGYVTDVINHGKRFEDKLNAYSIRIKYSISQNLESEAFDLAVSVLAQLGENFDFKLSDSSLRQLAKDELIETMHVLDDFGQDRFMSLFKMSDQTLLAAMKLMADVIKCVFRVKPLHMTLLACRMIKLSISRGICSETCIGLIMYSVANLNDLKNIDHCYRWGKLAISLLENLGDTSLSHRVNHHFLVLVRVWIEPVQSTAATLVANYQQCQYSGDNETTANTLVWHCLVITLSGKNLAEVEQECSTIALKLFDLKQHQFLMFLGVLHNHIMPLARINNESIFSMMNNDRMRNEDDLLAFAVTTHKNKLAGAIYCLKMFESFWCREFMTSMGYAEKYMALENQKSFEESIVPFYVGVMAFELYRESRDEKLLGIGESSLETLEKWKNVSKWNFENKFRLLEAEHSFSCGNFVEAASKYKLALELSKAHRFQHEEGLVNEHFGYFNASLGNIDSALDNFSNARECYKSWGAVVKDIYLEGFVSSIVEQTNNGA